MPEPVTDPDLIERLNARARQQQGQQGSGRKVTDPQLVERLNEKARQQTGEGYSSETWLGRRAEDVTDIATGAYESAFPERDPQYADTPGFAGQGLPAKELFDIQRGKTTAAGFEDPAWRKLVMETLGDRVQETKRDAQGNEIVVYRGDDGEQYETYINRPGLDMQDFDRFVSGSMPYAAAAFLTSRLPGIGRSLLTRAPAQGAAASAVSVGQDVAADQPVDLPKAGITGAFGAGGEVVGYGAGKLWRHLTQPRYFDETTGKLTKAGRKQAEKLDLDPTQVEGEVARRMADIRRASDPREAAAGIEAGEFNIPTTKGQRTKDPEQLHVEEQMRRSQFGPGARDVITDFDQSQRQAIASAADDVRGRVAPRSAETVSEAGQDIGEGLRGARAASDEQVSAAWREAEDLYPVLTDTATGGEARTMLSQTLRQKFDDLGFFPDEGLTPTADRMMRELEDYASNVPTNTPYPILGKTERAPSLDNMRRRLLARYRGAESSQDKAAARAIYSAFDDWMEGVSDRQFIRKRRGHFTTKDQAKKISEARKITREQRQLFEPKDKRGKLTPAGKLLTDLSENADTPERIVQSLFGANVTSAPKAGTVPALKKLKKVFENDPARWDQVRGSYFLKMITAPDGKLLSPQKMKTAMDRAFEKQGSVIDTMFAPDEKAFMRRFQKAVERTTYVPPNPSGTSYALESMRRRRKDSILKYLMRQKGQAARFRGEHTQANMWHVVARILPDIFNLQDAASRSLARQAISDTFDFKPDKGTLLSGIAAIYAGSEEGRE